MGIVQCSFICKLRATVQGHNWTNNLCSNVHQVIQNQTYYSWLMVVLLLPVVVVCQTADIVTPTVPFRYINIRGVEQWITIPKQVFQGFIYVWKMHRSNCIYCDSSQYIGLYLHNFDFLVIFCILNPSSWPLNAQYCHFIKKKKKKKKKKKNGHN